MTQTEGGKAGKNILTGYVRPFTRQGFIPFIICFAFSLIPIVQILAPAIAYSDSPSLKGGGAAKLFKTSLKMLFAALLLFAPAAAFYLLCYLLGDIIRIDPSWIVYIPLFFMTLFAVSALIRLPMAFAALAAGRSVKEALDGRFVKLLISAGFGGYLASLACLFPFLLVSAAIAYMPFWLIYVFGAFLSAWVFFYLGFTINRCYERAAGELGIPHENPPRGGGGSLRPAVAVFLITAMLGQASASFAFLEDEQMASGDYPKNQYTSDEYNEALDGFIKSGQLNKDTKMYYDSNTGRFYCAAKPGKDELTPALAGFVADCLPVISTIKNTGEFVIYKRIADDPTKSPAERAAAKRMQYYKFVCAALSVAGPLGKAASAVTGKGVVPFLIARAGSSVTDPKVEALLKAVDKAFFAWDRVGDAEKITSGFDEDLSKSFGKYSPEGTIGAPTVTPGETPPAAPGAPPQTDTGSSGGVKETSPNGDYSPFWGTYRGTLVCPTNEVTMHGVTGTFANPEVTITLDEEGYMNLSYTFASSYSFSSPGSGVAMSGTTTLPVDIKSVYLTRTLAGYMGDYESRDFTATTVTSYSGQAYQGGGGEASTSFGYKVEVSVLFSMVNVDGKAQTIASGTVIQTPLTGNAVGDPSMYMTFDLVKAG